MNKKTNSKQTVSDINNILKIIQESFVFDDETNQYNEDDMTEDDIPEDEYSLQNNDKISQIRALALEGIQDYADDVDSEEYDFFKKIWLMCDKVCSEKENNKENNI